MRFRLATIFGLLTLGIIGFWATGCNVEVDATTQSASTFGPGDQMVQTNLYFGLGLKSGGSVTPEQWAAFVNQIITPRFPDGLTILSGQGQWRGSDGKIERENSMEVIIIHGVGSDADRKIEEIRNLYKKQFDQESVLRTSEPVKVRF